MRVCALPVRMTDVMVSVWVVVVEGPFVRFMVLYAEQTLFTLFSGRVGGFESRPPWIGHK